MNISSTNIFSQTKSLHGPRKYLELANDIPNKVHEKLFNTAIKKLIADLDNYDLGDFKPDTENGETWEDIILSINEIPYSEYWFSSDVLITFKHFNLDGTPTFKRFTFDLDPYWGNCYDKRETSSTDVKFDNKIPNDIEIVKYDYLRGKATVRSKLEDVEYDVDFDELNKTDIESPDISLPYDTFTNLASINL